MSEITDAAKLSAAATTTEKPELVYDPINRVIGGEYPSVGTEWVFNDVKEQPIAKTFPVVTQRVWDQYKRAVDNLEYDLNEARNGEGRSRNLIWACGQVYGAATTLAAYVGVEQDRYIIPAARNVAQKYGV